MTLDRHSIQDHLIDLFGHISTSIMLVGSHANNSAHTKSDIDVIIISENHKECQKIISTVLNDTKKMNRRLIDFKIFTLDEYNKAKTSEEHFFLWSCMQDAICLHGIDLSNDIRLSFTLLRDHLWHLISQIEEVIGFLDLQVQFSGSCFHLNVALSTAYFVKKQILKEITSSQSKEVFIQSYFDKQYTNARERYYWVVSKIDKSSRRKLRISKRADSDIDHETYEEMREKAEIVLTVLRHIVEQLNTKRIEIL